MYAILVHQYLRQEIHFLFCGDGPDLEHFREKANELRLNDFVSFPGLVNDIPGVLGSCDFAIHASQGEVGYSLSILEYMYAGLPVLVPSNPSVCEATDDGVTGFIYRENDIESAIDLIVYLAEHPDVIVKTGQNAKESVINNYNLKNTHEQLLESVNSILRQRKIL